MNTLKTYKTYFSKQLSFIYPKTEIDTFFTYLVEEYLELQRIDIIMKPDFEIPAEKETVLNNALERLLNEEPIQYIIGHTEFFGLLFKVNNHTLIPRPETEELVEWIIQEVNSMRKEFDSDKKLSILDIGTGSGCIPISLKKNLSNVDVTSIDISEKALETAKQNAKLNQVDIEFIEKDILNTNSLPKQYDIIVSNPPYIRNLEKVEIKNNVLQNEPHLALFVDDDNPLVFYEKIADLAKIHLTDNGLLFFEINQYLGQETLKMLEDKKFTTNELRKDIFNNDRMIKISKKNDL
ncbi:MULTISPECIES: peptide chain release factor N(5)-glutamine methyltransferase [unclassified Tenacibaculum]|uniref:peptide chain release factor N(5)-glutamine methyltransferase n=1 Tax=unclassified Tenacibaculum TaxID=2635139 RepID=UPI001F1E5687|nr:MULTISPECIES: peptide chain release factor N(5)-glutamine methyltransferase [unclassified Tenacibaculum]MCF2873841.1 peptide chain release factor N(5)-glutamine methyltransferase [Tenacibaculum sp. Cn5-1]MCF2936651.1 peptide chain release factor N(5)-glutamine methyltransferase [Tenacibaculum sp. Cn5-34]MCG7512875.1 peptide chain release factor N(5)-glutamine methyltransferase [Tenacibaculum sp. Cn5-46]